MITPKNPGRPRSLWRALLMTGLACGPTLAQTIPQAEPDDTIGTANQTGLTAGSTGLKVAYGHTGDGPFVGDADGAGDFDFYKLSAAAGQTIVININNAGSNPDFDPALGLYLMDGATPVPVALNDDRQDTSKGYDRTPEIRYTAEKAGDYYVCVTNWINYDDGDDTTDNLIFNLPQDPLTPGTAWGPAGGTPGPYQLLIGLGAVPAPEFLGSLTGYPIPALATRKVPGLNWERGVLSIRNAGSGPWEIENWTLTGPNASQFMLYGMPPALTLAPGEIRDVTVYYDTKGTSDVAEAALSFTSNDPANLTYALSLSGGSLVTGGGRFTVKQVPSTVAVGSLETADEVLAGTNAGTPVTEAAATVINYGDGANGNFTPDTAFPGGNNDNFVILVTGTIFIKEEGFYTFAGYSDDGQRLRVDGEEVFSTTGYNVNTLGGIELTAGTHTVEYVMYEGGGGNSAELMIAREPGEFANFDDTTWELLEAHGPDTDGDGIGDALEEGFGTNPAVADATSDLDNDGLNNISEILFGTNISNEDSDGDGLKDGVETNTGIWAGTGNTGTHPLIADTDNDGLPDNVENPELATTGPEQSGTDPNKLDTDGDGTADFTEITQGTNPKDALSVPSYTYQTFLTENFDGGSLNSSYAFTTSGGEFIPGLTDTGVAARGMAAQLTDNDDSSNNSIAWSTVDLPAAPAVRLTFDFRMTPADGNIADGFGIGFFRSPAHGGIQPRNPGAGRNWENPAGAGGGFNDAVVFGFGVYGTNYLRLTGPQTPATTLRQVTAPFTLRDDPNNPTGAFHRAIITLVSNSEFSSMAKLEIIQDVDGAATRHVIMDNVLIIGFNVSTETFRVIAGGRTGALYVKTELDNVELAAAATAAPSLALTSSLDGLRATILDSAANAVNAASVRMTVNGTAVTADAVKTGAATAVTYTTPAGTYLPPGLNSAVITYSDAGGNSFTETRSFFTDPYVLLPASLALPASAAGTPGFSVTTLQTDLLEAGDPPAAQTNPNFLDYAEGVFSNLVAGSPYRPGNLADPDGSTNGVFTSPVINFEQDGGTAGFFTGANGYQDQPIPGIPGTTGSTDNIIMEALTWINFPSAGVYRFGLVHDDGFRVSAGHDPVPAVSVVAPASAARVLPVVPGIRNHPGGGGITAPYPNPPVTAKLVAAAPIDASTALTNAADVAGGIALIDRGNGSFAQKMLNAQAAGAIGVIVVNQTVADGVPIIMGGESTGIDIPGVMISKGEGDALKALLAASPGAVQVRFGVDTTKILGEAHVNTTTEFSVLAPAPGLYPVRLLYYEGGGGAHVEWYSFDEIGVRRLLNDPDDDASLKAYATTGAVGDGPTIGIVNTGGAIQIQFTGTLQSSPDLTNFTDVPGATSPYTVPAGAPARLFFRARP